jgi:CRP-like cAMP-binding protein
MTTEIVDALGQSDVFCSLDRAELDRLASACGVRSYGTGEQVFLRGDHGDSMYVVAAGSVAVSLDGTSGRDVLLAILGRPQTFGELAVVDGGPRVATVTCREPTRLVLVPRSVVVGVISRWPSVSAALLTAMAAMVRRLDEQACDATLLDLPRRVEKFLVAAAGHRGGADVPRDGAFVPVVLPLTQGDLARQIGGSRQQVNRILMDLEAAGSIERLGHRIVGVRPELLYSDG